MEKGRIPTRRCIEGKQRRKEGTNLFSRSSLLFPPLFSPIVTREREREGDYAASCRKVEKGVGEIAGSRKKGPSKKILTLEFRVCIDMREVISGGAK